MGNRATQSHSRYKLVSTLHIPHRHRPRSINNQPFTLSPVQCPPCRSHHLSPTSISQKRNYQSRTAGDTDMDTAILWGHQMMHHGVPYYLNHNLHNSLLHFCDRCRPVTHHPGSKCKGSKKRGEGKQLHLYLGRRRVRIMLSHTLVEPHIQQIREARHHHSHPPRSQMGSNRSIIRTGRMSAASHT